MLSIKPGLIDSMCKAYTANMIKQYIKVVREKEKINEMLKKEEILIN